jgi:outer membrane protein assembly factor BamA
MLVLGIAVQSVAQNRFTLQIKPLDKDEAFIKKRISFNNRFSDSIAVVSALQQILFQLQEQSYLEASIDNLERRDTVFYAFLTVGNPYEWATLNNGNVEDVFLSQVGYRERLYSKKPFNYLEVVELQESLLQYAENNGFPFAAVWLDSIEVAENKISAQLFMQKNKLVLIDTINIIGGAKISAAYLENYLGIEEGSYYSKSRILKIRNRLREVPFLQEKSDATVTFAGDKATINLFLENKKASRFDFLFGFLPTNTVGIPGGPQVKSFQFTATVNADLRNQFGLGERIFVEFEQLRPETQRLDLQFQYPYIFNLPIGIDTRFFLYKRDSSYLDVDFNIGLQYLFEGGNYLKLFWNQTSTTLLTVDTQVIVNSKMLPSNLDVTNSIVGLEYNMQKLDYRYNPRKGWSILLKGGNGLKQIKKNSTIIGIKDGDFNYESLYDSITLKSFQYNVSGSLAAYLPLFTRGVVKAGVHLGGVFGKEPVYQNEQFRIGGNRIMRGYDEESIFATRFTVFTMEYRFLIGQNSYLYAFGDYGYIENVTPEITRFEHPLGFGAGITFETKVGLFGFSLALGRLSDNTFDLRNVKSHFGYVTVF